ncbi:unnamed protein product [Euphydryas editha]|uniref:Uncharacterized protein n=1 Tax=Euphydryas editha TaxID=104508 RepID=A0AAU9TVB0_EUPED|nr:unnamed protein product [Euphydryas editha]
MHLKRALGECHGDGTGRYCRSTPAVCAATRPPCTSSARSVSVTVTVRYGTVEEHAGRLRCHATTMHLKRALGECHGDGVRYGTVGARRPSALPRDHHAPQARAR